MSANFPQRDPGPVSTGIRAFSEWRVIRPVLCPVVTEAPNGPSEREREHRVSASSSTVCVKVGAARSSHCPAEERWEMYPIHPGWPTTGLLHAKCNRRPTAVFRYGQRPFYKSGVEEFADSRLVRRGTGKPKRSMSAKQMSHSDQSCFKNLNSKSAPSNL